MSDTLTRTEVERLEAFLEERAATAPRTTPPFTPADREPTTADAAAHRRSSWMFRAAVVLLVVFVAVTMFERGGVGVDLQPASSADTPASESDEPGSLAPAPTQWTLLVGVLAIVALVVYAHRRGLGEASAFLRVASVVGALLWLLTWPLTRPVWRAGPILDAIREQHGAQLDSGDWYRLQQQRVVPSTGLPTPVENVDPALVAEIDAVPGIHNIYIFGFLPMIGLVPLLAVGALYVLARIENSGSREERVVFALGAMVLAITAALAVGVPDSFSDVVAINNYLE